MNMKNKNEKGSITLFVLVIMGFLVVFLITNYMGIRNELGVQDKQVKTIQKDYMPSDIDEVYNETEEKMNKK